MKTLLLVRHAKSSWSDPGINEADRPLNDRGKEDAPAMAKRLKNNGVRIDAFISSTAKRARRTARYFAEEYKKEKKDIILMEELYMATPEGFAIAIAGLDDRNDTVALFSHNPGITEYASGLTSVRVDNMPTCAVFAVSADTDKWEDFARAEKKFLFFDYPKNPLA